MGWATRRRVGPFARASSAAGLALSLTFFGRTAYPGDVTSPQDGARPAQQSAPAKGYGRPAGAPGARSGVLVNDPRASQGYTLLAPMESTNTYLIEMQGRVVHTWRSDYRAGLVAYLLDNGHLLRAARGGGPGAGSQEHGQRVQEFTWDGALVWDFDFHGPRQSRHHDICRLPNGNVLLIVSEWKTPQESAAAGHHDGAPLQLDAILEVRPTGKMTGKVVWEWHPWDHLIQDHDKSKAYFGDVAGHPELIDINFRDESHLADLAQKKDTLARLRALGYVGPRPLGFGAAPSKFSDLTHTNSVAYNAELDQIMLSIHHFSEIWVIDHGTTTAEAASHAGGRRGKGGDLLYRWGNPRTYRAGTARDQQLFFQHDAHWVPHGYPGEGHAVVFNNGFLRPAGEHSSVEEIVLPVDRQGLYPHKPGTAFGPERPVWSYTAPRKEDFYSSHTAGADRLPNGDTLICSTMQGTVFEATHGKEVVWKYQLPLPPAVGRVRRFQNKLRVLLTPEQLVQLGGLQKATFAKLEEMLTEEQKGRLRQAEQDLGNLTLVGLLLPPSLQGRLGLTAEQKAQGARVEKLARRKLDGILEPSQKEALQKMVQALPPRVTVPALAVFRAYRYAPSYPGLAGRDLTPGWTLEQLQRRKARGP
jgi:hypothetical protein